MNPINEALMLLGVGMGTVFVVLLLIIWLSGLLIKAINRWFPEKEIVPALKKTAEIQAKTIAAITAAVGIATKGRARVEKIEKIN